MVEDALGLKIYQYKIKEAERNWKEPMHNMKEVVLLRRENAPHLNFLKKQVEKFEKAKEMQVHCCLLSRIFKKRKYLFGKRRKQI